MEEEKTKKSLKCSVYEGAAFAVMDGMTASFMAPFAIALNSSTHIIAALTYVPHLFGAFVQLLTAKIVEILKDRKKILVVTALIHAVLWIPLLLIPYVSPDKKYLIIVYVSIQAVFAELMSPVWNSLMGDIVPVFERGRYFAVRNKVVGVVSFMSAITAGIILNYFSPKNPFLGFAILFGTAFFARALSGVFRSMLHNPSVKYKEG